LRRLGFCRDSGLATWLRLGQPRSGIAARTALAERGCPHQQQRGQHKTGGLLSRRPVFPRFSGLATWLRLGQPRSGIALFTIFASLIHMADLPKPPRPGPPHNPGVRDLVAGKRQWSARPKRDDARQGFQGWHERGYLPHRDEPGLTQFVTFHLADSFPASLRSEWAGMLQVEDDCERR